MTTESMALDSSDDELEDEDIRLALEYLLSHKMAFTQQYLRERGLPFSGTKAILRERLVGYLQDGLVSKDQLVALLNRIEGWGNQHIYFYLSPDQAIDQWRNEESTRGKFKELGLDDIFNRQRPLILPDEATLSSIEWSPERLRLLWVEKRQWEERVPEEDIKEEVMVWKAYRQNTSRGITIFEWDLISGNAMLMIERLPRGTRYENVKEQYEDELRLIIPIEQFLPIRISRAIESIQGSGEVRRRQLAYETRRGGRARFTSSNRSADTYDDPALERSGQALGENKAGWLGNFYWLQVPGKLERELHVKLYAPDQRVGIFGERQESEVRYVISRIRYHSR